MLETISHYRIEGEIGRGGIGVVYRAVDVRLGRRVAIKVLQAETTADAERHLRFVREAQSASALNHPNIVTIYEIGEDAGTTFIAMELVDGTPLDRLLAEALMPVATALDLAIQITAALKEAHDHGIVHRDIKPANIVVTRDGRAKVLDFGLAKLIERGPADATITAVATQPGVIVGTAAYMSPEQAEGRLVTAKSDIFSLGAVLYEMLAGRRPFSGDTHLSVITSILRDQPPPIRTLRANVPPEIDVILHKALAKDVGARYPTAAVMHAEIAAAHARLSRRTDAGWQRPLVLASAALVLIAVAGFGLWQMLRMREVQRVRLYVIPEVERLQFSDQSLRAVGLARQADKYAPDEVRRIRDAWFPFGTTTIPEGAEVSIRNYTDLGGPWESLGTTPIRDVKLPRRSYRIKLSKPGFVPLELSYSISRPPIKLVDERSTQQGMVFVEGDSFALGVTNPVNLPDFWMDKFELTNREFKKFVDAGGYRDPQFWREPFLDNNRPLSFEEAMVRFRDSTGRNGPATWELGSYPEGMEEFPVGGLSWYEAAAYAVFAKKELPTVYHWYFTAGTTLDIYAGILRMSNFDAQGPVKVGERQAVGLWGTFDMAGNIKEWCANRAGESSLRYILGGGWNEPVYRYFETDARDPWRREPNFGVRLIRTVGPAGAATTAPVAHIYGDPSSLVPVSDELFSVYRRFYDYDRLPLEARLESTDESPHWRKEKVSFKAAYGRERIPAYLFLPKNAAPPYQTVVYFPTSYSRSIKSSEALDLNSFQFIVRSGRAVLYPVYQGTFERLEPEPPGMAAMRDRMVMWGKDFLRAVDYLASRQDVDMQRLAYYGFSMGSYFGPIAVALEPRIKAAVFAAGGLRFNYPPEIQPANFMPRVKVPVLLINGSDDFQVTEAARKKFLELLGTAPEYKKLVQLDGGHIPNDMRGFFREVLDWLDEHLGPIR